MCGSRGRGQGVRTPLKNHKNIGFLSYSGPDPLKYHKATEPAFNVGPSSARQRNAISMAYRLRADDGQLIVVFGSNHPSSKKDLPLTKFSGSAHVLSPQIRVDDESMPFYVYTFCTHIIKKPSN